MHVALMIEGQEGVTWPEWCALADACEQHGVATLFLLWYIVPREIFQENDGMTTSSPEQAKW